MTATTRARRHPVLAAVVLTLALALTSTLAGPARADSVPDDAVISGRVVDVRTGAGVAGAQLEVQRVTPWGVGGISGYPFDTSDDGTFRVTGLAPGTYRIGFDATFDNLGGWYHGTDVSTAEDLTVAAHSATTLGDLPAGAAAHIRGQITDPQTGGLLRGTWVLAGGRYAEAGPNALYDIGGLSAGSYVVSTSGTADRLATAWSDTPGGAATPVSLAAGEVRSGVDIAPPRAGHLAGVVRDGSFQPAAFTSVRVEGVDGTTGLATATADRDGAYDVGGLATGTYAVFLSHPAASGWWHDAVDRDDATRISVVAGQQTQLDPRLPSPSSLSGTVTEQSTGRALRGVQVRLGNGQTTTTAADGAYSFPGLTGGRYDLTFSEPGHLTTYYPDALRPEGAVAVALHGGESKTGVDVVMTAGDPELLPGGRIRGTVTDRSGQPVAYDSVVVFRRGAPAGWVEVASTGTDAAGRYTIAHLEPGRYRLQAGGYRPHGGIYWGGSATVQGSADLVVDEGASLDSTDLTLPRTATMAGTLSDGSAAPLAGRLVEVTPMVADDNASSHFRRNAFVFTDTSGRWAATELPPGVYRVGYHCAHEPGGPDYSPPPSPVLAPVIGAPGFPGLPASGPVGASVVVTVIEGVDATIDGTLPTAACGSTVPVAPTATIAPVGPDLPGAAAPSSDLVVLRQPQLHGSARTGSRLTVTTGGFVPAPDQVAVVWSAGRRRLPSTALSLRVTRAMVGKRISSTVTVTRPGFGTLVFTDRSARVRPSR